MRQSPVDVAYDCVICTFRRRVDNRCGFQVVVVHLPDDLLPHTVRVLQIPFNALLLRRVEELNLEVGLIVLGQLLASRLVARGEVRIVNDDVLAAQIVDEG